jgi:hypothetical protein
MLLTSYFWKIFQTSVENIYLKYWCLVNCNRLIAQGIEFGNLSRILVSEVGNWSGATKGMLNGFLPRKERLRKEF